MAHSLESFITTLRADGVEAGRHAAEAIRREADAEARRRIEEAEAKARSIVQAANDERDRILANAQTELKLAVRDTVAGLREELSRSVTVLLKRAVGEKLDDTEVVATLILETVRQYVAADAVGKHTIEVNVSDAMRKRLVDWAIKTFHDPKAEIKPSLDLRGTLSSAGFEYSISGGTVEITPESVGQALARMVTPGLQDAFAFNSGSASAGSTED